MLRRLLKGAVQLAIGWIVGRTPERALIRLFRRPLAAWVRRRPPAGAPRVMVYGGVWHHGDPARGPSANLINLDGPLKAAGCEVVLLGGDDYMRRRGWPMRALVYVAGRVEWRTMPCDAWLLWQVLAHRPECLVFSWSGDGTDPQWSTLALVRQLGVPVVANWFDTSPVRLEEWLDAGAVDLHLVYHSIYLDRARRPARYHWTVFALDPTVFHPGSGDQARDIDIGFSGDPDKPHRAAGLAALEAAGLRVSSTRSEVASDRPTFSDYADVLRRTRIGVGWSLGRDALTGEPIQHLKGRVGEVLSCGAMLLESANSETRRWFEPGVHYVEFDDDEDLVTKARYYLEHEDERAAIAARGQQAFVERFGAVPFWTGIREALAAQESPA